MLRKIRSDSCEGTARKSESDIMPSLRKGSAGTLWPFEYTAGAPKDDGSRTVAPWAEAGARSRLSEEARQYMADVDHLGLSEEGGGKPLTIRFPHVGREPLLLFSGGQHFEKPRP